MVDGIYMNSVEFLLAWGLAVKVCFFFSWKNNSFFENDPHRNEKIALCCVGSTASFEVGTAQCYVLVYKPRKSFYTVIFQHFYLGSFTKFTLSSSPFWCLRIVLSQQMAISYYANVSLGYKLLCLMLPDPVVGGDAEEGGLTMGDLTIIGRLFSD